MAYKSVDDAITRVGGLYTRTDVFRGYSTGTTSSILNVGVSHSFALNTFCRAMPNPLPAGITKVYPMTISFYSSSIAGIVVKLIKLASIDISGTTGTLDATTGGNMPTKTEMNVSRQIHSNVIAVVTTALNATPGSLSITYIDQDGNTAETTTAQALTASSLIYSTGQFVLNSGDVGVRQITAVTRSGGTTPTGTLDIYGMEPVGSVNGATGGASLQSISGAPNLVSLGAGEQLGIISYGGVTSAHATVGEITYLGV